MSCNHEICGDCYQKINNEELKECPLCRNDNLDVIMSDCDADSFMMSSSEEVI
jgi:hypothetical protein